MGQETLRKYEQRAQAEAAATGKKLLFLIVDLSPVTDVDASAVHFLKVRIWGSLQEAGHLPASQMWHFG